MSEATEARVHTCECVHPRYAHKVTGIHTTGYEHGPCTQCTCLRYSEPDTEGGEGAE